MTQHRALQALRAVRTALVDATRAGGNVQLGRFTEVFEEDAIDIHVGPDVSVNEFGTDNSSTLDSIQRVYVDLHTRSIERHDRVLDNVFELRAQSHVALLADPKLGLAFVISIRYQGTEDFAPGTAGDRIGSMRTVWDIAYRMEYANPAT